MTKTKLKVKVDIEFEIELSTKRKTCTDCNGTGQIETYDSEIGKDGCDACGGFGYFNAQIDNAIEGRGNENGLKKYLSSYDLEKIQLLNKIIRLREELWSKYEQQPYENTPKFSKIERI